MVIGPVTISLKMRVDKRSTDTPDGFHFEGIIFEQFW